MTDETKRSLTAMGRREEDELGDAVCDLTQLSREPANILPPIEMIAQADLGELAEVIEHLVGPEIEGHTLVADALQALAQMALQWSGRREGEG